ncbi:MAG: phosphatidate cytidylyltransferase [Clostridiales bacterium]|jgi:CDP-diglyceride synthetase|nr:phosphatidate cytidylyltransferase [Clostridiales bacterium]
MSDFDDNNDSDRDLPINGPDGSPINAPDELPQADNDPASGGDSSAPDPPNGGKLYSGLKQRIITAAILAVVYCTGILLGILVHRFFYDFFILGLMIIAGLEVCRAVGHRFAKPLSGFVVLNAALGFAAFMTVTNAFRVGRGGITSFFGVLGLMFIACIVFCMVGKKYNMNNVISTLFVMVYPTVFMVYMLSLSYLSFYEVMSPFQHPAALGVILTFGGSAMSDAMAYFVGSAVKGPKLCPAISPKKTVSGAIGGLFGGIAVGLVLLLFAHFGWLGIGALSDSAAVNTLHFVLLGLGTSVFCQIGDLISSYIKRACGMKDFGTVLRGHGGFMDRIDGVILAGVFDYVYLFIAAFFI